MKRLVLAIIFFHLFFSIGFSQTDRKTIIENKIKAITEIVYKESGDKKQETKTYYSVRGDDSVKLINGEAIHVFKTILDKGRTIRLEREDPDKLIDEIHYYKYNTDSSYSIETKDLEEGVSRYSEYNSKHACLFTVLRNGDTLLFRYNSFMRPAGISLISDNKRNVEFDFAEFDSFGNVSRFNYKIEGVLAGFSTYKYNDKGLQEEVKQFAIDGKDEKYMNKTQLVYEFWE